MSCQHKKQAGISTGKEYRKMTGWEHSGGKEMLVGRQSVSGSDGCHQCLSVRHSTTLSAPRNHELSWSTCKVKRNITNLASLEPHLIVKGAENYVRLTCHNSHGLSDTKLQSWYWTLGHLMWIKKKKVLCELKKKESVVKTKFSW